MAVLEEQDASSPFSTSKPTILRFRATNDPFLRNLDSVLKEKLSTWLGPAYLELRRLTWDSPASVLAKVAEHEVRPRDPLCILSGQYEFLV